MTKRKFDEISSSKPVPELSSSQKRKQERLTGYLENAEAQLLTALKLARGFERQKLSRRRKDAREKNAGGGKEVVRIDHEIAALNKLDFKAAAEFYLARTLSRIKTIASNPVLPQEVKRKGNSKSPYQDPADANVTARLFKTAVVKNAIENIEDNVRDILKEPKKDISLQVRETSQRTSKEPISAAKLGTGATDNDESSIGEFSQFASDSDNESMQMAAELADDWKLPDRDDYEAWAQQFGDTPESGSEHELDHSISRDSFPNHVNDDTKSFRSTSTTSSPPSTKVGAKAESGQSRVSTGKKARNVAKVDADLQPLSKAAFLPTLAAGYISGSDEESFASGEDKLDKPKKRNRMGQQARRALAEQQYGAAAKHLRGSASKKGRDRSTRDKGWDIRKGAINGQTRGHGGRGGFIGKDRTSRIPSNIEAKPALRKKDDAGTLHPSWIAKKKLKEQQKSVVGSFAGKKVVFD